MGGLMEALGSPGGGGLVRAGDESGAAVLSSCAAPRLACERCPPGESPRPCVSSMKGFYAECLHRDGNEHPVLPPLTLLSTSHPASSMDSVPICVLLQAVCPDVPHPSLLHGTQSGCQASRGETLALKAGGTGGGAVCCPGADSMCTPHRRRSLANSGPAGVCTLRRSLCFRWS